MKTLRIFWGVLILILGIVLLLINTNLIGWSILCKLIIFWPVLVVLFGLGLIFKNWIVYLIVTLGLIGGTFYLAFSDPFGWQNKDENVAGISSPNLIENYDSTINSLVFSVDMGTLKFNLKNLSDPSSFTLLKGNYNGISHYEENRTNDGKVATVSIKEEDPKNWVFDNSIKGRDMDVEVTDQLPLDFTINTGASLLNMDFSKLQLKKLNINAGMSSVDVKLGDLTDLVEAKIKCGASAVTFTIPKDYGVKIISNSMLLGRNFSGLDMDQSGNEYATKGFDESKKKLTIDLSSGISKLSINTY